MMPAESDPSSPQRRPERSVGTPPLRVLHLEDNALDRCLVEHFVGNAGLACRFIPVSSRAGYEAALVGGEFDLILADCALPDYDGLSALAAALDRWPNVPFIFVSGGVGEDWVAECLKGGAAACVSKDHLAELAPTMLLALRRA